MQEHWKKVKTAIKRTLPSHSYRMWIEPLQCHSDDNQSILLACPNSFSLKRVQSHYSALIEAELTKVVGTGCNFSFTVAAKKEASRKNEEFRPSRQLTLPNLNTRVDSGRMLRKGYTFDNFIVGGNNDFAYSASLALASRDSVNAHSLFLLSDTGMGKSHLSQAVGHHILFQKPDARVYYITAEDFSNEMVQSFKTNSIDRFKEKYRKKCDVLLLEDVHFLTGKDRTQIELALTLDHLFEADKKIIFSGCYLPGDIPKMNEQLQSRLSSGLISKIDPPDFKTRVKILRNKARQNGCSCPMEILEYLASELTDNVRQIESGLVGVATKSSLLGMPIDLGLAQSVVQNIAGKKKTITIDVIKKLVCREYGVTAADIVSRSRRHAVVKPRQMAIYLSRKYTDQPLKVIGKSFNRYHATAIHSIKTVERGLKEKKAVQKEIDYLSKQLESGNY